MKKGALAVLLLLLSGCTAGTALNLAPNRGLYTDLIFDLDARDESVIQITRALEDFREGYGAAEGHKAFAQSGRGAWSWTSALASEEHAVRSALIKCRAYNRGYEAEFPCRVINVDGSWTGRR